jgi:glycerophosphoryl diester phosphodiesterase
MLSATDLGHAFESQGHRGARGLAPENTLPAFARALSIGVDTLELDTAVTADGVVVVLHDSRLNPNLTRNRAGQWLSEAGPAVRTLTLRDLGAYDVGRIRPGSRYAGRFPDQEPRDGAAIPTLKAVIELTRKAGNRRVRFNIETKLNPLEPDLTLGPAEFAGAVLDVIAANGIADRVTIQSFDWRTLREVQRLSPGLPTAYLTAQQNWLDNIQAGRPGPSPWTADLDVDDFGGSLPRLIKAAGGSIWSPYYRDIDAAKVKEAHDLGLLVKVWTVNRPAEMGALIDLGVDGIITDYPDRLLRVMKERGMKVPPPTPVSP